MLITRAEVEAMSNNEKEKRLCLACLLSSEATLLYRSGCQTLSLRVQSAHFRSMMAEKGTPERIGCASLI